MEASRTRPEGIMLPPSPMDSVESLASSRSSSSGSPAPDDTGKPERSRNVMITLSLTPDPPASSPSRQPFTRSHFRSRSLADDPGVPVMIRAHSSPGLDSRGRYIFVNGRGAPGNMTDNTPKRYLPLQIPTADSFEPRMPHRKNISETISEHAELDTSGSATSQSDPYQSSSPVLSYSTPRIGRRRPSSPLHFPTGPNQVASSPSSAHSSPSILSSRYNEAFPSYSTSSASSMPSTPTSLRSRSPSISSLETIPDIPDAEAAAIEADRVSALKAAADRADEADDASYTNRRRGGTDLSGPSSSLANMRTGAGGYLTRSDKRKRWSVCGAERRQDLDLETIWED
ncbi:hypothetical protein BJX68DRAFT_224876 [Aspergillus pseudodeflectus]|uniref:Basic proline-rich protein n=2 Tax=Aspergillus subgen. Nidulantes TaxID=2720870 RepID=A0A0U5G6X8_ASPCI|nr:hypothetical protein ASPCAL11028 [Aspergillus calidoustus]